MGGGRQVIPSFFGVRLLLAFVLLTAVAAGRDFYSILGVKKSATDKQIKKAYRSLAAKYHPDRNPGDKKAADKFNDISAAHAALTDADQRKLYDREGEEGLKKKGHQQGGGNSMFNMFGGMFGQQQQKDDIPKGGDIKMDIDVSMSQLYNGDIIEIMRAKSVPKEAKGTRQCNCRNEMKTVQLGAGRFQMAQQRVCDSCPNVKLVTEFNELDVDIEVGMAQSQEITYHGEGEPHIDGEPGNLVLKINLLKHPVFTRHHNDLYCNASISLRDALLGFEFDIEHLDGHKVTLSRSDVTAPGTTLKVRGEGMKHYDNNHQAGDLYVTFSVVFPSGALSAEDAKSLNVVLTNPGTHTVFNGLEQRYTPAVHRF